jgi:hypothetical protein
VNRLKRSYNEDAWRLKQTGKTSDRLRERKEKGEEEEPGDEEEMRIKSTHISKACMSGARTEHRSLPDPGLATPDDGRLADTSGFEARDPSYEPPETPRSRRQLQSTRQEAPLTRARARLRSTTETLDES